MNRLDIKHDLTGLWTCPVCTYERTPERRLRCGVCDAVRPGHEQDPKAATAEEEEEFVPTSAKKAKTTVAAGKPPGRLILLFGQSLRNLREFTLRKLSTVAEIEDFLIGGTVDEVRQTRDNILMALKKGLSCLVYDIVFSKDRQAAWLTIASRVRVPCDIVVGTGENGDVQPGFANVLSQSNFLDQLFKVFEANKGKTLTAANGSSVKKGAASPTSGTSAGTGTAKAVASSTSGSSTTGTAQVAAAPATGVSFSSKVAPSSFPAGSAATKVQVSSAASSQQPRQVASSASTIGGTKGATTAASVQPPAHATTAVVDLTLDSDED